MLSMGVPMMVAGDEFMRSQGGNNNTYCHDNDLNWFNWDQIGSPESQEMIRFWSMVMEKRKRFIDHFKGRYFTVRATSTGCMTLPGMAPFSINLAGMIQRHVA